MGEVLKYSTHAISNKRKSRFLHEYYINDRDRAHAEKLAGLAPRSSYDITSSEEGRKLDAVWHEMKWSDLQRETKLEAERILKDKKAPSSTKVSLIKSTWDLEEKLKRNADPDTAKRESIEEIKAAIRAREEHAASLAKPIEDAEIVEEGDIFE